MAATNGGRGSSKLQATRVSSPMPDHHDRSRATLPEAARSYWHHPLMSIHSGQRDSQSLSGASTPINDLASAFAESAAGIPLRTVPGSVYEFHHRRPVNPWAKGNEHLLLHNEPPLFKFVWGSAPRRPGIRPGRAASGRSRAAPSRASVRIFCLAERQKIRSSIL
jgi:hypothetical protein